MISFVKKFVGPNNIDMMVAYVESEKLKTLIAKEFSDYNVPLAIVDTYEWGQNPSFVLVVTDEAKSPLESVARHHFADKTFAVITMVLCENG